MSSQQFIRAYPAEVERTGPRQLSGRLVPYDLAAEVLDELPGGKVDIYQEGFRRGAFSPQANSKAKGIVNKIGLVHRHGPNGLGYLGPFIGLREEADGLYGDVRILPSLENDVAALLDSGVDELSVEFRLPRSDHTLEVDGVRWRVRAHLDQVALEPKGAYSQAMVLAYRAEMDEAQREQAEAQAREDAERKAAEQAEADKQAAAEKVEAERKAAAELLAAEEKAAAERRQEFEALASRYDSELEKQKQLVREYGVTQPEWDRRTR